MRSRANEQDNLFDTVPSTGFRLKLGRTSIYDLIALGELELVKFGKASRITERSIQRLAAKKLAEAQAARSAKDAERQATEGATATSPSGEATPRGESPFTSPE